MATMKYFHPAGYSTAVGYNMELELKVELSSSVSFTITFAVLSIPVNVFISWGGIQKYKFFNVLAEIAETDGECS
jgi:hypothetical protein